MAGDDLSVVVVDAPSNLGLSPPGEGREPGVRWLGAEDGGGVVPPTYSPEIESGTRNGEAVRCFAVDLAERVGKLVGSGKRPLVLGGDCSILIGSMLALRSHA